MFKIENGHNGKERWIKGTLPMKKGVAIYVNTLTGEGVNEVLDYLKDFISYQASSMSINSFSTEDIIQELNIIAINAIKEYDVVKEANLLTFLQNHIKNRIINLYKFNTEMCRTATHENVRYKKVSCPKCGNTHLSGEEVITKCVKCGNTEKLKAYPVQIPLISANEEFAVCDEVPVTIQDCVSYESTNIYASSSIPNNEDEVNHQLALIMSEKGMDKDTNQIVKMIIEGNSLLEICRKTGYKIGFVRKRIKRLRKNKYIRDILK